MIDTSIILATYNWDGALNIILDSLSIELLKYPNVEVVIADDGSNSKTKDVIDSYKKKIKNLQHVWHEDNGFQKSQILNKAVAKSAGEYLIFLDGDCIPFPDYIEYSLLMKEHGYFVAGNRVLLSEQITNQIISKEFDYKNIFTWSPIQWFMANIQKKVNKFSAFLRFKNAKWRYSRDTNWKYPKGCNFAVHRVDFINVNGFDESFTGWGHEDADLFIRLLHNGIKIKDARFAVPVLHLWHKEHSRDREKSNYNMIMERLADTKFTQAKLGVVQYL